MLTKVDLAEKSGFKQERVSINPALIGLYVLGFDILYHPSHNKSHVPF